MKNILIVLSGPSGVGKGTIADQLIKRNKNICFSISCTTRQPRSGETNGKEYFFVSKEDFKNKLDCGGFLEYSEHFDNYYGTPKDFVEKTLKNKSIILDIDVNGGLNIKKTYPEAVLIMLLPPSIEVLKNRLINRRTETDEQIKVRMSRIDYEVSKKDFYDYVVINDDLITTIEQIESIIEKEKNKR